MIQFLVNSVNAPYQYTHSKHPKRTISTYPINPSYQTILLSIGENNVQWHAWRFNVGFSSREGVVLHGVTFHGITTLSARNTPPPISYPYEYIP